MSGYDYASAITGYTTEVQGRFALRGSYFELLADGSVASGGPGRAPGPLDLLVSALVANMLNVLRDGTLSDLQPADDGEEVDREVQVRARVSRYPAGRLKVGRLLVEVLVGDLGPAEAEELLQEYRRGCRVLPALETVLDVELRASSPSDAAA